MLLGSIAAHGHCLSSRQFAPSERLLTVIKAHHRDAAGRGADQVAKIAADAFRFVHDWITLAVNLREGDALVRAVFAGDVAEVALDALRVINARDRLVVEIEI